MSRKLIEHLGSQGGPKQIGHTVRLVSQSWSMREATVTSDFARAVAFRNLGGYK